MNKRVDDPGLGALSKDKAQRFINPNGEFNVVHLNKKKSFNETYTYLIQVSWSRFLLILLLTFIAINTFFGIIYTILGVENLGLNSRSFIEDFINASFFSVQTITTLGYGHLSPLSIYTGFVSSLEAVLGLVTFAFVTGLLYGRFSKPRANIKFSKHFLLSKHNGVDAITFRLMSRKKALIINPKIRVSLSLSVLNEQGNLVNEFFNLDLERDSITYLPTTWTLVHHINNDSPLKKFSKEEIKKLQAELLILFSYYDELYNQELHQVHSYIFKNLKINQVFEKAFYYNNDGKIVLDHNLLDKTRTQL